MRVIAQTLQSLPQVLVDGVTLGAVYATVALGYTMVYGILELINFAHGEIFMSGAFIGTAILLVLNGAGWLAHLPKLLVLLLTMLVAMALTGLLGMGIERVAYRPLRNAPRLIPLISAIGVSFVLQDVVRFIAEWRTGNYIVTGVTLYGSEVNFGSVTVKSNALFVLGAAVVMMAGLDLFVRKTKWGTAMRAVAQDKDTAALMSINVNRVIALTFFMGSALGGATGVLFAQQYGTIDPYIGFILGLKAFTAAVLGGIGNIRGAMFGGFVIGILEMFASAELGPLTGGVLGAEYKDVFAFVILIAVLLFKPEGLFGQAVKEKV
ncbi:MAG: branched-chain amino acid ABC transporter permease [Alicyclobacillus macrosporangiidus]|uniref:branched-chain amino acid ABC transporter permease n=1 Tax=Alicyclobacillus macrosporangiidus TaxID=392015 RepID=UPI0026EB83EF|nr:branched-chain amino acid ABC transporter permease [Alicyclobacillus macrosporangiidus]MCL6600651.1 branched-chain amino acid ABC transporter permease [Alicyclobacillus macrosporangiidus]